MLHQPSGGAQGMASDIAIVAEEILRTRATLNELYMHHTGQDKLEVERVMERDTYFNAQEAIKFGVVDAVLTKRLPPTIGGDSSSSSSHNDTTGHHHHHAPPVTSIPLPSPDSNT
jgi:ATP-dependent Clp protease, protease subunit